MSRTVLPRDWITPLIVTTYLQWVGERGREEDTTLRTYRGILNRLAWWLRTYRQVEIDMADHGQLRDWRSSLTQDRASIILYVRVARGFYQWANRTGLVSVDPAWNVPIPRTRQGRPRPIAEETLIVAIENAPPRVKPWLILAACAGLRACEIARLRRQDIYDSHPDPYMIVHGKGGKQRLVPLSAQVWETLVEAGLPSGRGVIFRRRDGLPNRAANISQLSNHYLHDLGCPETLHQLRHRFGSAGWQVVPDMRVLQDLMGHSSPTTTAGYTRPNADRARELVDALQVRLAPG